MIALSCTNIKKEYGTDVVLDDISFSVNEGDKVALIGANGVGKSTLFKILTGELERDSGDFYIDRNSTVGYLSQNLGLSSDETVWDEVIKVFQPLLDMEDKLKKLEEDMQTPWTDENAAWQENTVKEYTTLQDLYYIRGGRTFRGEMTRVMTGLGITQDYYDRNVSVLSGGEKSRVALSKLLLLNPDIILMDEPTNHLDLNAVEWLEDYLSAYKGTLFLISHDRFFLDKVTDRTFLMLKGEILSYYAPYTKYLELHKKDYEVRLKAYELQQEEIKRQEAIIEKFRSFNREKSIRKAESRQKMLDKMEKIDAPKTEDRAASIKFRAEFQSGNDVIEARDLSKSFGERHLFSDVNFLIRRGNKTALIGENGRGKTTLFNIIRGKIKPDSGFTQTGKNVTMGYYDQEQRGLDPDSTVMDEVWDDFPYLTVTELRNALAQYLFKGDDVFKTTDLLSGGEKCRINLLKLMLREDNLLLLDEPTNHLDIPSREALEDSLSDYDGTMLVISHDRYFLNKVIDRIYELKEDGITEYLGNYSYYTEKRVIPQKETKQDSPEKEANIERRRKKEDSKTRRKRELRIRELEKLIEESENKLEKLHEDLTLEEVFQDYVRTQEVLEGIKNTEHSMEEYMEEWSLLSEEE